jgi:Tfp pilus assembly protein PilF
VLKARNVIALLVIGLGLLVYYNSLRVEFVLDDQPHITENSRIRHLWPPWSILTHTSRPVVLLSAAVNYALGGLDPWGYHMFNVGVHVFAALTLFGVARRTFISEPLRSRFGQAAEWLGGAVALIWLVHPLQTEAVTYTIQRGESLMGLFYLLTLYGVIRSSGASRHIGWSICAVASCALGMATKPVMATAPVVILLYDRAYLAKSWREVMERRWMLYACLAATWLLLPLLLANGSTEWKDSAGFAYQGVSSLDYALTQSGVILHYLRLSFWPHPLCFDYCCGYGWPVVRTVHGAAPGLMVVGALLAVTVWAWWRNPAWSFPGVWFLLILAPTSSFIPVADLAVEHRMYLPLAGVVAMVVVGGFVLGQNIWNTRPHAQRILAGGVVGTVVLVLAIVTVQRNRDYRSELGLWENTVAKSPNNPRAHNNLGADLMVEGRVPEAIAEYEQAFRIKPDYADAQCNLGIACAQLGRLQEAVGHFQQAIQIQPDYAKAQNNLGVILMQLGRPQEAIEHFEEMLRLKPDYAEAHGNLGGALMQLGRVAEAIGHFEETVRIRPNDSEARKNLAMALLQIGQVPEAIRQFEQALRIKPDDAEARDSLARLREGKT